MPQLELKNISKRFGGVEVLNGISLGFDAGTVTAIVGDNGAGKSTLLKLIAGIFLPNNGEIIFNNALITNFSALQRRDHGIEMVYQDLALAKQQDIVSNLFIGREKVTAFFFLNRRKMREEAQAKLAELEIRISNLEKKIADLSGGQQQAVAIARALMFNPNVLLLDEPTAALASREVGRVLDLINLQKSQGRAVILVSHRLNDVFAVSDRIIVLKHGIVLSDNPKKELTISEIVERIVS